MASAEKPASLQNGLSYLFVSKAIYAVEGGSGIHYNSLNYSSHWESLSKLISSWWHWWEIVLREVIEIRRSNG